jgi:hypothetical protein
VLDIKQAIRKEKNMNDTIERLICEKCSYDPNDPQRKNEEQYLQFRDEIERYNAGELVWLQLSECAKDVIVEFEWIMAEEQKITELPELPEDWELK